MFRGIIEGIGKVQQIIPLKEGMRLTVGVQNIEPLQLKSTQLGDSIAVNGCCLTVTRKTRYSFEADLSHETLRVTNLGRLKTGDLVNLERPMRLIDRIDGHLVQGHVDRVGKIVGMKRKGGNVEVVIQFPPKLGRYLISKGSITVDGISMTINHLTSKNFTLVVIPHTFQQTNLQARRVADLVNLEVDMVGKYVESFFNGKAKTKA